MAIIFDDIKKITHPEDPCSDRAGSRFGVVGEVLLQGLLDFISISGVVAQRFTEKITQRYTE